MYVNMDLCHVDEKLLTSIFFLIFKDKEDYIIQCLTIDALLDKTITYEGMINTKFTKGTENMTMTTHTWG